MYGLNLLLNVYLDMFLNYYNQIIYQRKGEKAILQLKKSKLLMLYFIEL